MALPGRMRVSDAVYQCSMIGVHCALMALCVLEALKPSDQRFGSDPLRLGMRGFHDAPRRHRWFPLVPD